MPTPNRIKVQEIDKSAFVVTEVDETGGIVLDSVKKPLRPIFCQSEDDVKLAFGSPTASLWGAFEAIEYCKVAPAWIVAAQGANSKLAGVDVETTAVVPFGSRTGRASIDGIDYANLEKNDAAFIAGIGDGIVKVFSGTAPNTPVVEGSLKVKIGGVTLDITDLGGVLSGASIISGTINYATGAYTLTMVGTIGTVAQYTTKVDLVSNIDLSVVASAGISALSSSPTQFVGTTVAGIPSATYDIDITIDSTLRQVAVAILVTDTWAVIATAIETALQVLTSSTETVAISSGKILVTSVTTGDTSTIVIVEGTTGSGGGGLIAAMNSLVGYLVAFDTPTDGQNAGINIKIDDATAVDVDLGASATTTRADIKTAIDLAVGSAVTTANDSGGTFIDIAGIKGDAIKGGVSIDSPVGNFQDAVATAIDSTFTTTALPEDVSAVSPTGFIPLADQNLFFDYIYTIDKSALVSHSFFAPAYYNDADYIISLNIAYISGTKYQMTIKETTNKGIFDIEGPFEYSLTREKNGFGQSIYIEDVFDEHPYVLARINNAYASTAIPTQATIALSGGARGDDPLSSDYGTAWDVFQKPNRFGAQIFMDIYGNAPSSIENLLLNFQKYSFGITCTPLGSTASEAIAYRQGLGIDFDMMALFTNYQKIRDTFNNSIALVSGMGKVGVRFARMEDVYDALSIAGTNENNHGGQLEGSTVIETDNDYTETELDNLDAAQINPIILDDTYGPMIVGDRTLQVANSDTSFIGTRRLYNLIISNVIKQVLRQQVFKLNDEFHRTKAKSLIESVLAPIVAGGFLNEALVVCDEANNPKTVRDSRKFIVDMFVQVTPNSQEVNLRFTRLSQQQTVADFL